MRLLTRLDLVEVIVQYGSMFLMKVDVVGNGVIRIYDVANNTRVLATFMYDVAASKIVSLLYQH